MIVFGADTHKRSHTVVAAKQGSGEVAGEISAAATEEGFAEILEWGRALDPERVWALEDCRHVSATFESFLVGCGERVVRIAPKLMGKSRRGSRRPGKSDSIDATNVARAALAEGIENLPVAFVDETSMKIKLLADHRDDIVATRTRDQSRLRWHLHALFPGWAIPRGALDRPVWLDRVARKLSGAPEGTLREIARELLAAVRRATKRAAELNRELADLVDARAPELLEIPGCGVLTAARIVAETAGIESLSSDAKLARLAGVAPVPASSGNRQRHRLDRGGNRQLNCSLHRIAIVQGVHHQPARDYLARKQAEGKTRRESVRCLKRYLARAVWKALFASSGTVPADARTPAICEGALT